MHFFPVSKQVNKLGVLWGNSKFHIPASASLYNSLQTNCQITERKNRVSVTATDHAIQIVILLLFLLHRRTITSSADYSPEMLPSAACSDKLVTFSSSCLPFIAIFPQNLTAFPPPQCCDDFSAAVGGDSAVCLLYAALQRKIVEFPIDSTKLLSLASVCPLKDRKLKAKISRETLCSGGSLAVKISSATGNINEATPMQKSSSDYPPETNLCQTSSSSRAHVATSPSSNPSPPRDHHHILKPQIWPTIPFISHCLS